MHNIIVRFASFPPQLKQINQDHIKISFIEENAQCLLSEELHTTSHHLNAFYCRDHCADVYVFSIEYLPLKQYNDKTFDQSGRFSKIAT